MRRQLAGSVVVVTGATSGIGRASAHLFADHDARLVLAARDIDELAVVVEECEARGAQAIAVSVDVGVPADVDRLRAAAIDRYDRIDTWVNAAGVLAAGSFARQPWEEVERIVATNVIGTARGSQAALQQFHAQGAGVLINVSSLLGAVPNPVVPVYTMTKYAIRGLSLSLHHDVARWPGIAVCTVMPGPVDTPMFEAAANHTHRRLRAIPPACAPERAAAAIVACARRPRRQVVVGWTGRAVLVAQRVAPAITEWAVARASARLLVTRRPAAESHGALFTPLPDGRVHGGWRRGALRRHLGGWIGRVTAGSAQHRARARHAAGNQRRAQRGGTKGCHAPGL